MCPLQYSKVCPFSPRCASHLFTAHQMSGLQTACMNMCNFDAWRLMIFQLLPVSGCPHVLQSLAVLELHKSQPFSQAASPHKTCIKVFESCGGGIRTCWVHLSTNVDQSNLESATIRQFFSSSNSLDIIKCELVCNHSLFVVESLTPEAMKIHGRTQKLCLIKFK